MTDASTVRRPLLVDGHVHFYPCFQLRTFLDSAWSNVERGAAELPRDDRAFIGVLLLAETPDQDFFRRLGEALPSCGPWTFEATRESESLIARRGENEHLILVAGRQLQTREGLEVLALSCEQAPPSGLGLADTLSAVANAEAIPVLPWGFGKWWLRRGRLVRDLLRSLKQLGAFLADSGGRPRGSPRPRLLDRAVEEGIAVLAGSDPLPLSGQDRRPGSFGFVLDSVLREDTPAADLRRALHQCAAQPTLYGSRTGFTAFLRTQVALRRRGKWSAVQARVRNVLRQS